MGGVLESRWTMECIGERVWEIHRSKNCKGEEVGIKEED